MGGDADLQRIQGLVPYHVQDGWLVSSIMEVAPGHNAPYASLYRPGGQYRQPLTVFWLCPAPLCL
jgi:hypothetical protein